MADQPDHDRLSYLPAGVNREDDESLWDGYENGVRLGEETELGAALAGLCVPCWMTEPKPGCSNCPPVEAAS